MKDKIKLEDAYFGIKLYPISYRSKDELKGLSTYNLFNFGRVKWSVAKYVTMDDKEKNSLLSDPLRFCFGDVWGRTEYEFIVCPWGGLDGNEKVSDVGIKVDAFEMYVEPNATLLMDIVNRISENSARKYLREERARRRTR